MKKHLQWLVLAFAILLPFLIIRTFPEFYHSSDMDDFWRWSQAWEMGWRSIYVNCERCNYPFFGTLLSGGVMDLINIERFARLANRFRYFLAGIDAINVLVIWVILQKLRVKDAPFWAGIIGLLPSSWLGSSVWGQIDGVGQFLILLFFLLLIWFSQEKRSPIQYLIFTALVGFLLSCMMLTKQLVYFSVFALGIIFLASILIYSRKFVSIITSGMVALIFLILPFIFIDLNLDLKTPYFSHLQYILVTGSTHGDIISSTGFNIWVFFTDNLLGTSHTPISIQVASKTLFSVIPYSAGILLFFLVNVFLVVMFVHQIYKVYIQDSQALGISFILMSFDYLALVNLSFNLTLTGTHERYLYHFYPFIIIACLAYINRAGFFNRSVLSVLLVSSLIYGAFLFGYLIRGVLPTSQNILEWMSAFHLILFGYLIYIMIRHFNAQKLDTLSST